MILSLFVVFVGISVALIILGLINSNETAMALIGFTLLFILSIIVLNGSLEYETGADITTDYTYTGDQVSTSIQSVDYEYSNLDNYQIGWYLAVASFIGFFGTLMSLGRRKNY